MVDPLAQQHTSHPLPPLHIRGLEQIDVMCVTPRISSAVKSSGSLSYQALYHSTTWTVTQQNYSLT